MEKQVLTISGFNQLKLVSAHGNTWDFAYAVNKLATRSALEAKVAWNWQPGFLITSMHGDCDVVMANYWHESQSCWSSDSWDVSMEINYIPLHITGTCSEYQVGEFETYPYPDPDDPAATDTYRAVRILAANPLIHIVISWDDEGGKKSITIITNKEELKETYPAEWDTIKEDVLAQVQLHMNRQLKEELFKECSNRISL